MDPNPAPAAAAPAGAPTPRTPPGASALAVADLRERLAGRVVEPHDADYDAVRQIVLGGVDPRPALVVRPRTDDDVVQALAFAREAGLPVAVRSGGHSSAGHGTVDGGLVIDLRDMTALDVDVEDRTVWAEAGLTAGALSTALAEHGLAVGFGDTGSVGIGGITLGGGVGYLSRLHGMTIDNVLAADLVTADGRILRVDADTPELFWALRGGGGNLGVVTRFRYRAHPVERVVGGMLVLPASADVVAGIMALCAQAPDELSAIVNVVPCPPMPFVPAEHHGRLVVMALICVVADAEAGAAAVAPFRALAEPIADLVAPVPYPALFPPENPDYRPTAVARGFFLDHVDDDVARTIVDRLDAVDGMRVVQLRVLGGAIARVPAEATAYAHRDASIMVNVAAFVDGQDDRDARLAWVDDVAGALGQGVTGAYVNFLPDHGEDGVRAAYPPGTWERLARVKADVDPDNLFRRCQNVPPARV